MMFHPDILLSKQAKYFNPELKHVLLAEDRKDQWHHQRMQGSCSGKEQTEVCPYDPTRQNHVSVSEKLLKSLPI